MATLSELRSEHQAALQKLGALDSAVSKLLSGQVLEAVPLLWKWDEFVEKALIPHFELEEATIIMLLSKGTEEQRALAAELRQEHTYLLGCFDRCRRLLGANPETTEWQTRDWLCNEIKRALPEHAAKEDRIIIPLIRDCLHIPENAELPSHSAPILYEEGPYPFVGNGP